VFLIPRRAGESVVLDGQIVITVLEVRGDKVRISIEAPPDVPIERGETVELRLSFQAGANDRPEETN
jgi:carbon storage regulator